MKDKSINKGINKEMCELKVNVFAKHEALRNQLPSIIITAQDPLISAIHDVIDEQLRHVKLKDEDIISVIKIINERIMKDQWNVGWGIKAEMQKKWFDL